MDVTSFLLLSCLSLVITAQAQECSAPVLEPNMNLKDKDLLLQTFPDGTQVTFACSVGYMSAGGSAVSTCTAGSWSPVRLKCERKNCGSAGEVEHGYIDYPEGTEFGDKAVITCDPGYRFVGKQGPREIICGDQGWLGRLPVCEVVTCEPPPAVVDGIFSPNKETYGYGEVVQYSCQKDFTLSGSKSVSCSDDGTFQPDPPTCVMVQCSDPVVENAEWVEGSRPPYRYKAPVTLKCRSGYFMRGEPTQICEINSQWSPGLPKCELVTCEPPPTVADGTFSPNKGKYVYGEVVQYSCQKDFTLSGLKSVSCSEDGTFKPAPPTCIKIPATTKATTTTTTTKKPTDGHCEDPAIENANWIEGSRSPHRYKATVTYQCISGFTMIGEPIQTCAEGGQWIPGLPTCERSKGNTYVMPLVISFVAITALLICCGCFYFGVPARIRKKLGSGRGSPDNEANKPEEEVALS